MLVAKTGSDAIRPIVHRKAEPVRLDPDRLFRERATRINFDSGESAIWEMPDLYADLGVWGSFYPNHDTYTAWEAIENVD